MQVSFALYEALQAINVPADKAKAVVTALEQDMERTLATKQDLLATKQELQHEIALVRKELTSGLVNLEQRMSIKLGGMLMIAVATLAAIIKL
jgi:hypothetical protein